MPRRYKSSDSESSVDCIYCGDHVSSTPPVQKSQKRKFHSPNLALSDRIRKRNFLIKKMSYRTRNNPIKRHWVLKRKQKKRVQRVQRPIRASAEGKAPMQTTPKLGESDLSPMYTGLILGLRLGAKINRDFGKTPPTNWGQYQELLLKSPSFLTREMQSLDDNLAQQSDNILSAENLSQETLHGSPAVIGSQSQNPEVPPGWPNRSIDLTCICTQTDSWSQLPNLDGTSSEVLNQIEEPAPSVIDSIQTQMPIQDDPMLKSDEDPAQKSEACLNEIESQIRDGDCNVGVCHPEFDQDQ